MVRGLAWAGLAILCWVPLFSVAKRTLPYVDAFALGSLRYLIGIAVFVALLAAIEGRRALSYDGRFAHAAALGVVGITGFNLFVWIGLGFTLPEHASIILALQTPLIALGVWLTRGNRPPRFTLGCVAVAIAGVLIVVTKGEPARAIADAGINIDAIYVLRSNAEGIEFAISMDQDDEAMPELPITGGALVV